MQKYSTKSWSARVRACRKLGESMGPSPPSGHSAGGESYTRDRSPFIIVLARAFACECSRQRLASRLTSHAARTRWIGQSRCENRSSAMHRFVVPVLLMLGAGCAATPRTAPAPVAAAPVLGAVTAEELRRDLYAFADDSMRGRETATEDAARAMRFLVARVERLGLEPAGDSGFLQRVPMQKEVFGPGTRVAVEEGGNTRTLAIG